MIKKIVKSLQILLKGKIPSLIELQSINNDEVRKLAETVNTLIKFNTEIHEFILPLSKGELNNITIQKNNFLASPFKELHSRLLHLTWQSEQVAKGDYKQRVDFMGDFSTLFNNMIISLEKNENPGHHLCNNRLLIHHPELLNKVLSHIPKMVYNSM